MQERPSRVEPKGSPALSWQQNHLMCLLRSFDCCKEILRIVYWHYWIISEVEAMKQKIEQQQASSHHYVSDTL